MTDDEYDLIPHNSRDATYGPGFFKFTEMDHAESGRIFANVIHDLFFATKAFGTPSVVELGCGAGRTLAELDHLGWVVRGVDFSADCLPFIRRHSPLAADLVTIRDVGEPWPEEDRRRYNLVISIEMLEHIAEDRADVAVDNICKLAPVAVVTACPPVGRNPLHLNEQPWEYWVQKFTDRGRILDLGTSAEIRRRMREYHDCGPHVIPAWYFSHYIGVFR